MNTLYQDVNELETYRTLESALMTCCHICGDRLEWTLEVGYDSFMDCPTITGYSSSCGVTFILNAEISNNYEYTYYIEIKYEDIPGR